MAFQVSLSELREIEQVGREVLRHRESEIRDGQLDGCHWFIAITRQAHDIVLRRKKEAA